MRTLGYANLAAEETLEEGAEAPEKGSAEALPGQSGAGRLARWSLLVLLAAAAIAVATTCVRWRPREQRERSTVGLGERVSLELEDCQVYQNNIDIWTRKPIGHINNVASADECRLGCESFAGCDVWTWGSRRGVFGLTNVCFLKAFAIGVQPIWKQKMGVISGFPCRREDPQASAPALTSSAGWTVAQEGPAPQPSDSQAAISPLVGQGPTPSVAYVGGTEEQSVSEASATVQPLFPNTTQRPIALDWFTSAPPEAYDCAAESLAPEASWSEEQRRWCCRQVGRACGPRPERGAGGFGCHSDQAAWSAEERRWCCQHRQRGCAAAQPALEVSFNCTSGFSEWREGWSDLKKAWCCKHRGRGCVPHSAQPALFKCETGADNWQAGWSDAKKEWCCDHQAIGCSTTRRPTPLPYDCTAGYSNCRRGWSQGKRRWCCDHAECCPSAPATTPAPAPAPSTSQVFDPFTPSEAPGATIAPTLPPSTTVSTTTTRPVPPTTTTRTTQTMTTTTPTPTTTITTTTTTTTLGGPKATTLRTHYSPGSLYCFALMQPTGYELLLMQRAWQLQAGIFDCDEASLLSSHALVVAAGLQTGVVDSDLKCKYGGEFYTALNTDIFLAVWQKVIADGRYALHSWTIKADPDCVFFPILLKAHLLEHPEHQPTGVYLNNCKYGLHGPIEIFSRNAVHTWAHGRQHCVDHFNKQCKGPCAWGEDLFIDQCLWKVLKVKRDNDTSILSEDHCDPQPGWDECKNRSYVAFHPFKTVDGWIKCFGNYGSDNSTA